MIEVLILCGGFGTRLNKDKNKKNFLKPLVKINNEYLLKRIMKIYSSQAKCKFILLGGYNYHFLKKIIKKEFKEFSIQLINTGLNTNTGGRIKFAEKFIKGKVFCLTYGDTLANFNLKSSLKLKSKKNLVINIYKYFFQYGVIDLKNKYVKSFQEKKEFFINAGFYILDKDIFEFIKSSKDSFENKTLPLILKSKKK